METALSIQSHPDKKLAERLHAERPHVYKDSNHKPEMALSLTDFEALCGFVQHEELCAALEAHPELRACVGEENVSAALLAGEDASVRKDALKQAFTALMTCDSAPGIFYSAQVVVDVQQGDCTKCAQHMGYTHTPHFYTQWQRR